MMTCVTSHNDIVFSLCGKTFNCRVVLQAAHLHLADMLMRAISARLWCPIEKVVFSVKRFSSFSASKDLPNNVEEGIVLWLNKVGFVFRKVTYISC